MRLSQGTDVGSLSVRTTRTIQSDTADLAPEITELLDLSAKSGTAHNPLDSNFRPSCR